MVAAMRFTKDICWLFGIRSDPSEQRQDQAECREDLVTSQRDKDSGVTQDSLMGEEGLSEEERARRRAERRRAKRKRQRERKRLTQVERNEDMEKDDDEEDCAGSEGSEKEEEAVVCKGRPARPLVVSGNKGDEYPRSGPSEEDPGWDVSSAFFANAASHLRPKGRPGQGQGSKENKENESRKEVDTTDCAAKLAEKGVRLWEEQDYTQAISMFTEAIRYDPKDHRFFGNRSCCYECLGQYPSALADAEQSIRLAPDWPKGYFRKGRALMGMKRFSKAEEAMAHVLRLDPGCDDATYDLYSCRILQLTELGFEEQQSMELLEKYSTVKDALASPETTGAMSLDSSPTLSGSPCPSLWVGNVTTDVTEKHLWDLFKAFGDIESIRVLHERFCAFVNFRNTNMAARAMDRLQGVELEFTRLVIRYPERQRAVLSPQRPASSGGISVAQQPAVTGSRRKGPINGDECYFWRTTGCHFGDKCRYKHVPEQRGRDRRCRQPQ